MRRGNLLGIINRAMGSFGNIGEGARLYCLDEPQKIINRVADAVIDALKDEPVEVREIWHKPTLPTREEIALAILKRAGYTAVGIDAMRGDNWKHADAQKAINDAAWFFALLKSDAADPGPSSVPGERCAYVSPPGWFLQDGSRPGVCGGLEAEHWRVKHDFVPPVSPTPSLYACGERHPTMSDVYCVYGRGHTLEHHGGGENAATHWPVSPTPPPEPDFKVGDRIRAYNGKEGVLDAVFDMVICGVYDDYGERFTLGRGIATIIPPAGPAPSVEPPRCTFVRPSGEICMGIEHAHSRDGGITDHPFTVEPERCPECAERCETGDCKWTPAETIHHEGCDGIFCLHGFCQECGTTMAESEESLEPATVAPSADAMHVSNGYGDLLDACSKLYQSSWTTPEFGTISAIYKCVRIIAEHAEATDRRFALIADAWDFPGTTDELRRRQQAFVDDVRGTK